MVTAVEAATALVLTGKVALVAPAATVTLPATVATAGLLLDSVTCAPPPGAGPPSVTVPVELLPPPTALEAPTSEERRTGGAAGDTVVVVVPPYAAEEPATVRAVEALTTT